MILIVSQAATELLHLSIKFLQGTDRDFSKKAIESLIKKLKDKREELDEFITTVCTMGEQHTKCITIPRTLDGRLQACIFIVNCNCVLCHLFDNYEL